MLRHFREKLLVSVVMFVGAGVPAVAEVTISNRATQNISCTDGICVPTATNAVLNVNDLEGLLASGNVEVTTTGTGVQAINIKIFARFGWSGANTLMLDAYKSVSIDRPVDAKGTGGFSVITNDGGRGGEFTFGSGGYLAFGNLSNLLTINGTGYMLVSSISTLAGAIAANPGGAYALAEKYNAGQDGTYAVPPISTVFTGSFNGLGNTISNLTINDPTENAYVGLFAETSGGAALSNVRLANVNVTGGSGSSVNNSTEFVGGLVGFGSGGTISNAFVSGSVVSGDYSAVGGLVGISGINIKSCKTVTTVADGTMGEAGGLVGGTNLGGSITDSSSSGSVSGDVFVGGLVGFNDVMVTIEHSFATGTVTGVDAYSYAGGLAGINEGIVTRSTASGTVNCQFACGGLAGMNGGGPQGIATISRSYAIGNISASAGGAGGLLATNSFGVIVDSYSTGSASGLIAGGLVGTDEAGSPPLGIVRSYSSGPVSAAEFAGGLIGDEEYSFQKTNKRAYWDTTNSGITNKDRGAGNVRNDPGIKGLSDKKLKAALPKGFNPRVWAQTPSINGGLPYLVDNPPPK